MLRVQHLFRTPSALAFKLKMIGKQRPNSPFASDSTARESPRIESLTPVFMLKATLQISLLGAFAAALAGCNGAPKHDTTYSSGTNPKVEITRDGKDWHILVNGEDKTDQTGFVASETVPQTLIAFTLKDAANTPLPSSFQLQTSGDGLSAFCGECSGVYKSWAHSGAK